jgi:Ca2+-binding RTX toxin-like protein
VQVFGLANVVNIFFAEQANDRLVLNGLGGDDVIDCTSLEADAIQLTINAGLGADIVNGSEGNDLVNGGDGDDVALLGAGDDTFVWNPGDDNDVLEGQEGFDTMLFNGANITENINVSSNGGRVLFTRDIANVVMDLNDLEKITYNALGGADNVNVHDLSGTDVVDVNVNLAAFGGAGDGAADTVIVFGTSGDDVALVVGDAAGVQVIGLASMVTISGSEAANDRIVVNTLAGDDVVEGSGLSIGAIQLVADGGTGSDVLIGGDGIDTFFGSDGDDVLIGGEAIDVLDGGTGDNIVIQ